ncbi:hypothetical protein [Streptomyces sp. KR55]|uniref:hypothetical protein n=1 Tax=Streptomyces sp. KR55 TaxID=3457425 RepID=UPI003FD65B7D
MFDHLAAPAVEGRVHQGGGAGGAEQVFPLLEGLRRHPVVLEVEDQPPVMSSRAFASRTRELVGPALPKEMILSNQRKHYPGIGLLTDDERDTGA